MTWKKILPVQSLQDNTAHVWLLDISRYVADDFIDVLSEDELTLSRRFVFSEDRERFVIVHGVLRFLLAEYLSLVPTEVNFVFGSHGKPAICGENAISIQFNLSHAHNLALLAFTKTGEIGVDIECMKKEIDEEEIAKRFFATSEIEELMTLAKEQRKEAFFNCWTRKEAFIKAIGVGLAFPLGKFSVAVNATEGQLLRKIEQGNYQVCDWRLLNIPVDEDYKAAIAFSNQIDVMQLLTIDGSDGKMAGSKFLPGRYFINCKNS